MQRLVIVALCYSLVFAVFCPGFCLAKPRPEDHACCHKGKATPDKSCTHSAGAQRAELPAAVFIGLPIVSEQRLGLFEHPIVFLLSAGAVRFFSPPPVTSLVLRL